MWFSHPGFSSEYTAGAVALFESGASRAKAMKSVGSFVHCVAFRIARSIMRRGFVLRALGKPEVRREFSVAFPKQWRCSSSASLALRSARCQAFSVLHFNQGFMPDASFGVAA